MEEVCSSFFNATSRFFSTDSKRQVKACAQIRMRHDIQGFKTFHASGQKVPNENVSLNSRRCKILVCRYHYRKAWYLIDL